MASDYANIVKADRQPDLPTPGEHIPSHVLPFYRTPFFKRLYRQIYGARKGGARIIVDGENSSTGSGKTSCAISLAIFLSKGFGYELRPDDLTLSGQQYLQRWKQHPGKEQPSVIILDEVSGAGAGDSRRSMSHSNVNIGRSWQLMRKKRVVTICTLPHWGDADARMRRFADFRLHCSEEPIGQYVPYKVLTSFDKGKIRTKRLGGEIRFPDMDNNRVSGLVYKALEQKKDELLEASGIFDADDLFEDDADGDASSAESGIPDVIKVRVYERNKVSGEKQEDIGESLGYTQQRISQIVREVEDNDVLMNQVTTE